MPSWRMSICVTTSPDSADADRYRRLLAAGPLAARGRVAVAAHRLCEFPVARARGTAHAQGCRMNKPMRDFTHGELEWLPWITPVDLDAATQAQLTALKITPSNRAVGAYSLVLAHDPEALERALAALQRHHVRREGPAARRPRARRGRGLAHQWLRLLRLGARQALHRADQGAGGDGAHPGRRRRGRARSAPQGDPRLCGEADARSGGDRRRPMRRRCARRA